MSRISYSSSIGNGYVIDNGIEKAHDLVARAIARKLKGFPWAVAVNHHRDGRPVYNMMAADANGAVIRNNIWFEVDA